MSSNIEALCLFSNITYKAETHEPVLKAEMSSRDAEVDPEADNHHTKHCEDDCDHEQGGCQPLWLHCFPHLLSPCQVATRRKGLLLVLVRFEAEASVEREAPGQSRRMNIRERIDAWSGEYIDSICPVFSAVIQNMA